MEKHAYRYPLLILAITAIFISVTANAQTATYKVDVTKSKLRWMGNYLFSFGEHNGTVDITSGIILLENEMLAGGQFEINMKTIKNVDMDDEGAGSLENHLKSKDFFDVDKFPTALLKITKTQKIKDPGNGPNIDVFADLTIKGITKPIKFAAMINAGTNAVDIKSKFKFDRTKWDIKFESGRFLVDAGDSAISDAIGIDVTLIATK